MRYKFLTHFFPSKTFQPFSFCHIHLFISGLPLNGWARQPFIAEGFGAGGDLFADYILFVSSPFVFVFFNGHSHCPNKGVRHYYLANCHRFAGAVRSRHARGASASWARGDEYQGGRNGFLRFQEQLLRRKKTEVVFGCFCWKWGARGTIFA